MSGNWNVFQGGPNRAGSAKGDVVRVTLSAKKVFLLNRKAFEALGYPSAVEFMFNDDTRMIGMRRTDPRRSNAFPLKGKGNEANHKRASGSSKYSYRVINAAPFCRHVGIKPEGTLLFTEVDLNTEGELLLALDTAVRVGRGSR